MPLAELNAEVSVVDGPAMSRGGGASREMFLPELPVNGCGVISRIEAPDDAIAGLMAMGVCVGRRVELVKTGDPLILRVLGTRIGVSNRLAQRVVVICCVTHTGVCTAPGSHLPASPESGKAGSQEEPRR